MKSNRQSQIKSQPIRGGQAGPMVWTWAGWEPLQFYRRLGGFHEAQEGNALWAAEWSRQLHGPATAHALKSAGINWVTIHFYKGFGLEAEASEIGETRRAIQNFQRRGVRVFAYIQYGTTMPETMTSEEPAAADWTRRDWGGLHDGHPYEYGDQYWRDKPCANHPAFRPYLLKCVSAAIALGADGVWFDNLNADGCHCQHCQTAFRNYVRATVPDPWPDLGLRPQDLERVTIPRAVRPRDPLFQLWIRCRTEEVRTSLETLCRHARQLNPQIVIAANIGIGNHQRHVLENANWHSMLELLDYTYAENDKFPAWSGGRIISQHYTMSIANAVGARIVPGAGVGTASRGLPRPAVPAERALRRCFTESAMFGGHALGGPWGLRGENGGAKPILLRDTGWGTMQRRLVEFYAKHWRLFASAQDDSSVGLLYNFESLLADEPDYRRTYEAMAQVLLQNQIPFRYLLSDRLQMLDAIKVLILPQVLPLTDETEMAIRAFVKRGGRVLATGRCGLYDRWMRQRRDYALADLFGAHFSNEFEDQHHDAIVRHPGTGCVLLPGEWGRTLGDGTPACMVTGDRVAGEVRALLRGANWIEVRSPLPHVGCASGKLPDGSRLLSLLNYADAPVRGLEIRFATPAKRIRTVKFFDSSGRTGVLPMFDLGGGTQAIRPEVLDLDLFVQLNW